MFLSGKKVMFMAFWVPGSGKSTTLGCFECGQQNFRGIYSWFDGELLQTLKLEKVGAIIEDLTFYPYMTAEQN
jgi:ABC-type lipoprotein export system ATPase subunit